MNIDFEYELELNGHVLKVNVEAEGTFTIDHNWGADADGNRGISVTDLDKFEVKVYDGKGNEITDKLEKKYEREFQRLIDKAEEKLWEAADE